MNKLLTLCACLLALVSCGKTQTAGSASVTTNGTVAGIITDSLGNVVANASATLIQVDHDPAATAHLMLGVTDSAGKYQFDSVPAGDYRLVVRVSDSSKAATVDLISVASSKVVQVPTVPVTAVGSIKIQITDFSFSMGDRFYLPGTDMEHVIISSDLTQGYLIIDKVPAGSYDQLMCVPKGSVVAIPLVRKTFQVTSAEYILVPDYEASVAIPVGFFNVGRKASASVGGAGGDTATVQDSASLAKALSNKSVHVVRIQGFIRGTGGDVTIKSNTTVVGIGDSSGLDSLGLHVVGDSNIVIRNLNFHRASSLHAITVEDSAKYVWIDHNTFTTMATDQFVIKRGSDYVTVSWNHFMNQKDMGEFGNSDTNGMQDSLHLRITFHHNWLDHVEAASPRVRFGTVHVFNNYYDSMDIFAINSAMYAKVVVESNVFENVQQPTLLRYKSTKDGELVAINNLTTNSGTIVTNGSAFDPTSNYSFTADEITKVKSEAILCTGAGKLKSLR